MASRPSGSSTSHPVDPYYGYEETAKLCARFLKHLFGCPDLPPLSTTVPATVPLAPSPPLANFIAYVLHRIRFPTSVAFGALYLLQRLNFRYPAACGSSGHRLFISAYMIASKMICDDTYSNKSWSIVGQGMFALREINQMEREMCSYLEWQLNFEPRAFREFEEKVRHDFNGPGLAKHFKPMKSRPSTPVASTTPYVLDGNGVWVAAAPSFAACSQNPPSMSLSRPMSSPVPIQAGAPPYSTYPSPSAVGTLGSRGPSMSTSTASASSASRFETADPRINHTRTSTNTFVHTPVQPVPVQWDPYNPQHPARRPRN